MKKPNGYIIYKGKSLLDKKPIVVIALAKSRNTKTGNMVQTYILRENIDPREANKTGEDFSICGNCPLKGEPHNEPTRATAKNRACYVNLGQGVLITYKQYKKGAYPIATSDQIKELGRGRVVRLGTYGDPASVPRKIWDLLLDDCVHHTGYSHQHDLKDSYQDITMKSVETIEQAFKSWAQGVRTFRTINNVNEIVKGQEILCPASKEAGRVKTCATCQLCSGSEYNKTNSKGVLKNNVAIVLH